MSVYKISVHLKKGRLSQGDFYSFLEILPIAVKNFNRKFHFGCSTKNKKFILGYSVDLVNQIIEFNLQTDQPIPDPDRRGNCLRELTVQFMKIRGSRRYLSPTNPGKLFRSKV